MVDTVFSRFRKAVAVTAAAALLALQAAVPVAADGTATVEDEVTDERDSGVGIGSPADSTLNADSEQSGDSGQNSGEGENQNQAPEEHRAVLTVEGLETKLTVNRAYDFTVGTEKGTVAEGTGVRAIFTVEREGITVDDIELCYYLEDGAEQGTCQELPLDPGENILEGAFGPAGGFPLKDESTKFNVVFRKPGEYLATIRLVDVTDNETVYAEFQETYELEVVNVSISTNLPDRTLKGQQREFTVAVDPGSHVGETMTGVVEIIGPEGIKADDIALSYKEAADGKYTDLPLKGSEDNPAKLSVQFGDEKGFTLEQPITRYFRITPKVAGTYHITIKLENEQDQWPAENVLQVVEKKPAVSFNLPSTLEEEQRKTFDVKLTPGDFKGANVSLRFTIERSRIDDDDVDLWYEDDNGDYQKIDLTDEGDKLTATYNSKGFPLDDQEIGFRIRFERTGNFKVTVDLVWDDTGEVLASDTDKVKIEAPDDDEDDDEDEEDKKDRDDEKPAADKPATPTTPAPAPSQPDMGKGTPDDPAVIRDNNTHGSTTAVVSDGVAHVTHQVTSAPTAGNLTIDLMESTVSVAGNPVPVGTHTVAIPASVISQLGAGQDVVIRTAPAELRIPPAVLQAMVADKSDGTARFSLKAVDDGASVARARVSGLSLAGQVVSLSAEVASGSQAAPVTGFVSPVTLRLSFSTFQVPQHLGVYRLTTTGEWEYVGGRVNSAGRYAEVELSGFSEYAVFEYTQDFVDVAPDHWARADIQLMASRHIVKGKQSGRFEPEAQVTRAEFTALLVRALNLKAEGLFLPAQAVFADVPVSHWSYSEVQAALQYGLVAPASSFRPDEPITRQEMAVMLNRALALRNVPRLGASADVVLVRYSDRTQIANWAQDAVSQTTQLGIMGGYPWGTFEPEKTATRAEAVTVLKRLMTVTGDLML